MKNLRILIRHSSLQRLVCIVCLLIVPPPGICGLTITADKEIYAPGDVMRITTSVESTQVSPGKVEAFVLWMGPDGQITYIRKEPEWVIADRTQKEAISIQLTDRDVGVFDWFFVFCRPGLDPSKAENWISSAGTEVFVLPAKFTLHDKSQEPIDDKSFSHPVLIAHGGGEYKGQTVTNTQEALESNYARGHRSFEIDFCWTSDEHLVAIHDWQNTYRMLFEETGAIPSLKEFESKLMKARTTPVSLRSLYRWLHLHPDAVIVTDVKERNVAALTRIANTAGRLKDRLIPQIYAPSELEPVKALGFERIILTLYRVDMNEPQTLAFARDHKVYGLTLSARKAFSFKDLPKLRRQGVRLYVHTINQPQVLHYFRQLGVDGIYTDRMVP